MKCGATRRDKRGTRIPCKLEYQRKYRLENRDTLRERYAEKTKAANAKYRAANKDKIKAYQDKYCEANREEARQRAAAYRLAVRTARLFAQVRTSVVLCGF